jgi:hypothetical protein
MLVVGAIEIVIILMAAVAAVMLMGGSGETNATVDSTHQQMVYKLSDFPSGWHASTATTEPPSKANTGWAFSAFNNSETGDAFEPMAETSYDLGLPSTLPSRQWCEDCGGCKK